MIYSHGYLKHPKPTNFRDSSIHLKRKNMPSLKAVINSKLWLKLAQIGEEESVVHCMKWMVNCLSERWQLNGKEDGCFVSFLKAAMVYKDCFTEDNLASRFAVHFKMFIDWSDVSYHSLPIRALHSNHVIDILKGKKNKKIL